MKAFLAAALGLAMALPLAASAQGYGGGGYWMNGHFVPGPYHGRAVQAAQGGNFFGVIGSIQGSSLTMRGGRTIFLKNGTVINGSLTPGARIRVLGGPAGNGNINASTITVVGMSRRF